jgi:hypothetical protein
VSGVDLAREVLASLQSAAETQTDFGGRTRVWSEIATVWVTLTPGSATNDPGQDQRPFRVETATATARDQPLAAAGQQLVTDDTPWRVIAVQRTEPGRMTLLLDRSL